MKKILIGLSLLCTSHAFACNRTGADDSDFPESFTEITAPSQTGITSAWYDGDTGRYPHGVLGDAIEPSILHVSDQSGCRFSVELGRPHVFEDVQTRLADIDGKPGAEVITIRSHQNYGAQIAIYTLKKHALELLTTTPYIGTANRWLAPVGIADFNNDGDIDIAYIDRPHLAKTLRVWTYSDGKLTQIASKPGYSNHRIGEDFISGGIKSCNDTVTMITADANWTHILATTLQQGELISKKIATFRGIESFNKLLQCQ